jgi:hypothetical protein
MHTLKEMYNLRSKLKRLDEAFDKEQMKASLDVIKQLKGFTFNIEQLDKAKNIAIEDVTESLRGEKDKNLLTKFVNIFKKKKSETNPIDNTLAFISAIVNFFELFTPFVEEMSTIRIKDANGKDFTVTDDLTKIIEMITGVTNATLDTLKSTKNKNVKKNFNDFSRIVKTGLKPDKTFDTNTWYEKYVGGDNGVKLITSQILTKSVGEIKKITQFTTQHFAKVDSIEKEIQSDQTQQTQSTQQSNTEIKNLASDVAKKTGIDANSVLKVIGTLNSLDKIK